MNIIASPTRWRNLSRIWCWPHTTRLADWVRRDGNVLYSRVEIQDRFAFSLRLFFLTLRSTHPDVFAIVEADVVALIARPEHNLQALNRWPLFRIRRIRRVSERRKKERKDISCFFRRWQYSFKTLIISRPTLYAYSHNKLQFYRS